MARALTWLVLLAAVLYGGKPVLFYVKSLLLATPSSTPAAIEGSLLNLTILHTNDLHSSVTGVGPEHIPDLKKGGYARMAGYMKEIRQDRNWEYLTVDAGDWYAGSLFDRLGPNSNASYVPELEYFHASGYDAINLGNHDFDATDLGLANMLEKANRNGLHLNFLSANIRVASGPMHDILNGRFTNVTLRPYLIKEYPAPAANRNIRVGVLGLFGPDAALCSTAARGPVTYAGFNELELQKNMDELVEFARNMVHSMRTHDNIDFVVVLLHGGPDESRTLATSIPGIDVIVSGHTHQSYYMAVPSESAVGTAQTTHVVQCGHSGKHFGTLRLFVDKNFKMQLANTHECVKIDATLAEDSHVKSLVSRWKTELPMVMNSSFAYEQIVYRAPDGVVFNSSMSFKEQATLVSKLLLRQVNRYLRGLALPEADVYLTCPTCVRSRVHASQGEVVLQFSDIYRMLAISTKCDMVVFYMRKEDLWLTLNIVLILEKALSDTFVLTLGGIEYDASSWGVPFINYFNNLRLVREDGSALPYEDWPALVRVATSTYIGKHIFKAKKYSFGVVAAPARDQYGNEVTLADSVIPSIPPEYKLLAEFLHTTPAAAVTLSSPVY